MTNPLTMARVLLAGALIAGCAQSSNEPPPTGFEDGGPAPDPIAEATADAPATIAGLEALFRDRDYAGWRAEPAFHPSRGPHGTEVRVFYGPIAAGNLDRGEAIFPVGAATVKEERSGDQLLGWSAWVKVSQDAAGGRGFFWYEILGSQSYGGGLGSGICTGCHSAGRDFLLSTP
jgi:hypothetical protein